MDDYAALTQKKEVKIEKMLCRVFCGMLLYWLLSLLRISPLLSCS